MKSNVSTLLPSNDYLTRSLVCVQMRAMNCSKVMDRAWKLHFFSDVTYSELVKWNNRHDAFRRKGYNFSDHLLIFELFTSKLLSASELWRNRRKRWNDSEIHSGFINYCWCLPYITFKRSCTRSIMDALFWNSFIDIDLTLSTGDF